jgi:hypothetical protein
VVVDVVVVVDDVGAVVVGAGAGGTGAGGGGGGGGAGARLMGVLEMMCAGVPPNT